MNDLELEDVQPNYQSKVYEHWHNNKLLSDKMLIGDVSFRLLILKMKIIVNRKQYT